MGTSLRNFENRKTFYPRRLLPNLSDKTNLKRSCKYAVLSNLSINYTWKSIKDLYKNNKFKVSASTWNDAFELTDGSYYLSYIQNYFQYIIKKCYTTNNPLRRIYVKKKENTITSHLKLKEGIT